MILDLSRLRALVRRALDAAGASEAEQATSARIACKEIERLGLLDETKVVLVGDKASMTASPNKSRPAGKKVDIPDPFAKKPRRPYQASRPKVVVTAAPGGKKGFREVD